MQSSEIRSRFLAFFERHGHVVRPSASLVPGDDPTLLFTNAGMVPFKKVFLGLEDPGFGRRATTSQKCVRAGGKHNDLEQVGHTARHHTFFEMLGNFSFGDYFKRDAIRFAWDFVTKELQLPAEHLRVTVFYEDHEARELWREIAGLPEHRIFGLGHKDNFWQMADTGPCGPCSEIYVDLAALAKDWAVPQGAEGAWTDSTVFDFSQDDFVEGAEAGRFLEIWNLVFMQFDRQADGTLVPLPKPSVDTGAGLERIAAVKQGVTNNFHTDLFRPYITKVEELVGIPYPWRPGAGDGTAHTADGRVVDSASYRVLADHARAVAFLLADGVFPSNEGRGYVLRRILRRAVRHAWLLGRREPTLVHVVEVVIDSMRELYPDLQQRRSHLLATTRAEEERFLATIDGGMARFEELAPLGSTQGSTAVRGSIAGDDVFRLYDTYGFPVDLTELMARERGYLVDIAGFEAALGAQRKQSQDDRKARGLTVAADDFADPAAWERAGEGSPDGAFVGYATTEVITEVTAVRTLDDGRVAVMLRESPFYAESGGQVSDLGEIVGNGWRVDVSDVKKADGRIAAIGTATGTVAFGSVSASVPVRRRKDIERNHTATHLLHAVLREQLGEHVHQAGSLVAPDRLRFDFTHHGPIESEQLARIEQLVNEGIWQGVMVEIAERRYVDAVASGAMALFGEKYGDVVRVVSIEGLSVELCGGTHVRNTAEIGLFRVVSESGVAAGIRRIEAVTGRRAFTLLSERDHALVQIASKVKVNLGGGTAGLEALERKIDSALDDRRSLERRLDEAMRNGGGVGGNVVSALLASKQDAGGIACVVSRVDVADAKAIQAMGDAVRDGIGSGVGVLGADLGDGKATLLVVVTDDLRERGLRADTLVRDIAALVGGRGGGKPHMAQAGLPDPSRLDEALAAALGIVAGAAA